MVRVPAYSVGIGVVEQLYINECSIVLWCILVSVYVHRDIEYSMHVHGVIQN